MSNRLLKVLFGSILISLVLVGCGSAPIGGTYVWIDVPQDGISFSELQPVIVKGHATGEEGVSRIELYVEGDLWRAVEDPVMDDGLAEFSIEWLPPELGVYTLEAIAYGPDDQASQPDQTTLFFGTTPTPVISVTPVISITPTLTDTPTPVPPAEPTVYFWAEPETLAAGDCTDIYWWADNVQSVILGGVEQPFEGSFQVCLCESETYTLRVIHLDDSEEEFQLNINIEGDCEDTDPPPAPILSSPPNGGAALDCLPTQTLVWNPVSDETGISQYQVAIQRDLGGWVDVSGSVFTGITGTTKAYAADCGGTYRWRVRAVDGASNVGSWSAWWEFSVVLP